MRLYSRSESERTSATSKHHGQCLRGLVLDDLVTPVQIRAYGQRPVGVIPHPDVVLGYSGSRTCAGVDATGGRASQGRSRRVHAPPISKAS